MFQTVRAMPTVQNSAELFIAVCDARSAADLASDLARSASEYATLAEFGADDAAEVLAAAVRARLAAEGAEIAENVEEAKSCARAAWAALTSAQESSARINAAIAENLAA